jgi:methionyl-tRNA synthetase
MTFPKKIYLTTSIPYVNSKPHVGHALELIQADVLARHYRLAGYEVHFQTGTDENAFKNVLAAESAGLPTQELVDRNAAIFRSLAERLNISFDSFIRTTEQRHRRGVAEFWKRLRADDVYARRYVGLYCVGCEDFYLDKDLIRGLCPDHGAAPKRIEEENFFFRLSGYQQKLERLIGSDEIRVVPITRKNEVLRFIRSGLQDISISRSSGRSGGWGIPVPGHSSQVIYVWIDALINYLTGQGFGEGSDWERIWNCKTRKIHVVGKNIWKFHAVYWPALLLSAGLPLPDEIFVHGFLTENGRKISKSLGNTVNPFRYIDRFGADGLRHFLLKAVSPFDDGDFSDRRIADVYETDLANGLGNLISRVTSLCAKSAFHGRPFRVPTRSNLEGLDNAVQKYRFDEAVQALWAEIARLNQEVARVKPWVLLRTGRVHELHAALGQWVEAIQLVALGLAPFLPESSRKVLDSVEGVSIQASLPLFPRLSGRFEDSSDGLDNNVSTML